MCVICMITGPSLDDLDRLVTTDVGGFVPTGGVDYNTKEPRAEATQESGGGSLRSESFSEWAGALPAGTLVRRMGSSECWCVPPCTQYAHPLWMDYSPSAQERAVIEQRSRGLVADGNAGGPLTRDFGHPGIGDSLAMGKAEAADHHPRGGDARVA